MHENKNMNIDKDEKIKTGIMTKIKLWVLV